MSIEESVDTGEVKACQGDGILRASAIGSCVVVTAYDQESRVGGMAHVMLPGASPERGPFANPKYAEDSVEELIHRMRALGADGGRTVACLVGGANILGDRHDSPGPEIVRSLNEILDRMGLAIVATGLGGTRSRSCCLDVARGRVAYTIDDSEQRVLWEAPPSCSAVSNAGRLYAPKGGKGVRT